ncbi:MAG: protein kinase [Anaerolineae bacterium]|nr:protein kinase [Anaerolineae bacterium]
MTDLGGQTLGRYQIIERLGRGGMADVYKAYQPGLDRYVAVKVLHPHLSEDPSFITRFQREAKAVASLRHPNIVQVFDFDVQVERYFMVMEYIEGGKTLKEVLHDLAGRGERLPLPHTLDICAKLADALDYAHSQGMVHRDIKPANVLLPTIDNPVLSDFGIARIIGQTGLTASGAMIGTPAYMSPEQGRGEKADERTDIYALGIVFYEMMTGQPPYDADTPYGVILKHINDPLVPPHKFVEKLPKSVERVVLKSLAKDPLDRYPSAGAMRNAVLRAREDQDEITGVGEVTAEIVPEASWETVSVAGPTVAVEAPDTAETELAEPLDIPMPERKKRKVKWWVAALVVLGAMIVIGGGVFAGHELFGGEATAGLDSMAEVYTGDDAHEGAEEAPAGFEELGELIEDDESPTESSRLVEEAYGLIYTSPERAEELLDEALDIDPTNTWALTGLARIYLEQYDFDSANEVLEEAYELDPYHPEVNLLRGALYTDSDEYYNVDTAMSAFGRAIQTNCVNNSNPWLCVDALERRANLYAWYYGEYPLALEDINWAIETHPEPEHAAPLIETRAYIFGAMEDFEQAEANFREAYERGNREITYLENGASFALSVGRPETAIGFYEQLIAEHPENAEVKAGLAYVFWEADDYGAAMELGNAALEQEPDLAKAKYVIGLALIDMGDPDQAIEMLGSIVERDRDSYAWPFLNEDFGHEIHYDLGRAVLVTGDYDWALGLADQSAALDEGWPYPYVLRGDILAEVGEVNEARRNYGVALEFGSYDPELAEMIKQRMAALPEEE